MCVYSGYKSFIKYIYFVECFSHSVFLCHGLSSVLITKRDTKQKVKKNKPTGMLIDIALNL